MGDVVEIRVHGVGGAPGARQLGLSSPDDVVVVQDWVGSRVLARRDDHGVRSYEWGDLTSGSPLHALWILLLPFTLLNVAGWMHPHEDHQPFRHHNRILRVLVALLGMLLTATFTLWVVDILVGLVAYQWAAHGAGTDGAGVRVGAGFVAVVVFLAGLAWLAVRTQATVGEPHRVAGANDPQPPAPDETLASPTFFARRRPWYGGLRAHVVVTVAVLGLAGWRAVEASTGRDRPDRIDLAPLFLVVAIASAAALVALAVTTWIVPYAVHRRRRRRSEGVHHATGRATAAVALAFTLATVYGGGASLWLATVLGRPDVDGDVVPLPLGGQTALMDAVAGALVAWVGVAVVLVGWWGTRTGYESCPDDELPDRWRARTARAQAVARIAHKGDVLGLWLAGIAVAVNVGVLLVRTDTGGDPLAPWQWSLAPPAVDQWPHRLAAWALPALVGFYFLQLRGAGTATRFGRAVGQVWDVLTFWPRRFHPLAVRPYAQRVVPELRALTGSAAESGGVVVSAHSQGSVLAFAALAPMQHGGDLARVALVTYGSPLGTLHARTFPAYCNQAAFDSLRSRLLDGRGGWHNYWRHTDPIGGPVLADADADRCLPDPGAGPELPAPGVAGLEPDRQGGIALAVHAHYLREPVLKSKIQALKGTFTQSVGDGTSEGI